MAKRIGGSDYDEGYSITVDIAGNIYTTGCFSQSSDFDPGTGTYYLNAAGGKDIFISKLNSLGNFVWARQFGGSSDDVGNSITVDASGNIYFTGYFQGTADFNPGPATFNLTSSGDYDVFVCKISSSGNLIWARQIGGNSEDVGNSIAIDTAGNVYTTGYFQGTADFNPGTGTYYLSTPGGNNIFISKLDPSGNYIWAEQLGDGTIAKANSIAYNNSGYIYITGSF